ncbi:universal stress protein [Singulisphaera acidiphila]|uniref:Amino acid transporter n=1 Tax=Singulisphaera acidiphila (strain ATCC BAA-1392 / DSM 18658 / VKM B-2454 / MOB10) TaxID=886293 RepID=L0DJT2_SINAD|nr:universal stress protein [Singulisphaera acidiphila]AGA28891.1 amino acid transporter [Singulisphaera acidiphila DSM 18658]
MLSTGERPRELHWYHAGPMLFGDWGTSRLYVLGLAFAFNGRASFWYIAAMCLLMIGVGWCYTAVCRLFPDGGGVYSAARQRSELLAVVGALLLCADYVVTASLSCLDAFHYLGIKDLQILGTPVDAIATAVTILLIGFFNAFGPTKTGFAAMLVALATIALTLVIGIFCLPHLMNPGELKILSPFAAGNPWQSWVGFTEIVLALSGVEAVANMTGIMVPPVERTAKRTILPVLVEIVILNLILAAAMNALPDQILYQRSPDGTLAHTGDMLKVIAHQYVDPVIPFFSAVSAFVFAALLLSAVNTAVGALVSVQFMLARDKELPKPFTGLNRYGMPFIPLVVAAIIPAAVVLIFPSVAALADLYAIGVVGAIAINLGSISTNRNLKLKTHERAIMIVLTVVLIAIELTIAVVKPHARSFALLVLVVGLAGRLATIASSRTLPLSRNSRFGYLAVSVAAILLELFNALVVGDTWPSFALSVGMAVTIGYLTDQVRRYRVVAGEPGAELALEGKPAGEEAELALAPTAAPVKPRMLLEGAFKPKMHIMVPTQGNTRLIEFAIEECKSRQAELQILFIRHLAVTPMGPTTIPTLAEDEQALQLFERLRTQAHDSGVPLRLLYGVARDIPDAILDMAVTHGANMLLLGLTRRGALWKAMKGDVIQGVAEHLPEDIGLLIYS